MTGPGHSHGGQPLPAKPAVSARRLIAILGSAGALAGGLIVVAWSLTLPPIEANRARRLDAAISEVLSQPARYDTLYVAEGGLWREPPAGTDPKTAEKVYLGYQQDGTVIGYAIVNELPGFADVVRLIFGYDPATRQLLGMKVLESKETPGLGDKIEKDSAFVRQFVGLATPVTGVKPGAGKGGTGEVDLITGATISSRIVVRIINSALDRLGPALEHAAPEAP
jgi:electron transport complex protein RnfG